MGLRLGWCWLVYKGPIVQCLWIDDFSSLHLLNNQIQKHYCFCLKWFFLRILTSFWKITQLLAVNSSLLYSTTGICFIAMFCDICCPSPHITFHYTLCNSIWTCHSSKEIHHVHQCPDHNAYGYIHLSLLELGKYVW